MTLAFISHKVVGRIEPMGSTITARPFLDPLYL